MAADAAVSVGVVLAGAAILFTGWLWIDPVVSLAIAVIVFLGTWSLLRDSVNMALDAVPESIDVSEVQRYLSGLSGVTEVHDLHIWAMSTTESALTSHLVMQEAPAGGSDALLRQVSEEVHERFGIEHVTLQIETGDPAHPCTYCRTPIYRSAPVASSSRP
jgi:cobalt-zinc-cadmium efflux system protein